MKYSDYKIHPFADHLPLLSDQEMSDLAADIKQNGQRLPIIRCNGVIIDGRNRLKACEIAGVEPNIRDREDVLKTDSDVAKFIISINLSRRHVLPAERAAIAVELIDAMKKDDEKVAAEKAAKPKEPKGDKKEEPVAKPKTKAEQVAEAAKLTGSSKSAIYEASKIKEEDPKKFEEIKKGEKSLNEAKKEIEATKPAAKPNPAKNLKKAEGIVKKCRDDLREVGYMLVSDEIEEIGS
jgi:ParB-like chromosome segregation protein Spo0J